jgi:DNA polymerase-3 subunit alpha (Gram-positive type)
MEKKIFFSNMFPDYAPPDELNDVLAQAAIVAADIDVESGSVAVMLHSDVYIPQRLLQIVSREVTDLYGLRYVSVSATHPAGELTKIEPGELMALFVQKNSMNRSSLAGARWEWEGDQLTVRLLGNGKKDLQECVPFVQQCLRERFAAPVTIQIEAGNDLTGQALFDAIEKMRSTAMTDLPKLAAVQPKKETKPVESDMIYGKPFKGAPVPMKDLSLDMGFVVVEGKVFAVEHKELKKRNAWVVNFDMTDNYGSVRINRFFEANEAKPIIDAVKVGSVLKVQGKLMVNNFDNEMVLKPFSITTGTMGKRKDKAVGEKRVELHLHTAMSNMDALTSTKAAIKQAAAWGHKAIAITDHGCCQSFTDALHTVEDWKGAPKIAGTDETIKILYGCEGYYVNDVDDRVAVIGDQDMAFDEEYVAFDLETTGLSIRNDKIIEIGAVIMKNGVEIDRFQTFVDPAQKISKEITEITGITNEMLVGAPPIAEVMAQFRSFVGDRYWLPTMRILIPALSARHVNSWAIPTHLRL